LISLQWHVLVLTLRLAVYTLFGKARLNLGKNFLHPQKYTLPYTCEYGGDIGYILYVFTLWLRSNSVSKPSSLHQGQGRNEGGAKMAQFPGRQLLLEAPKSPNNVTITFFDTVNLPSKELRFHHRGAKHLSCGRRICFLLRAPSNLVTPLTTVTV